MNIHQMVTFYIPLSRPLRVPPEEGVWLERDEPLEWLYQYFPHLKWKLPKELYETKTNFVLLRVAQMFSENVSIDMSAISQAFDIAANDVGHEKSPGHNSDMDFMPLDVGPEPVVVETVLVVSTPLLVFDIAPIEHWISEAFDRCLDSARRYEMAYAIESGDLRYTPLTRVTSPHAVPYTLYDFENSRWSGPGLFMVNWNVGVFAEFGPNLSSDQLERMRVRFGRIDRDDPWNIFVIMSRAANRSLEIEGDFASAVLQAYTSGEAMLDTLLQSMGWEVLSFAPNTKLTIDEVASWFSQRCTLKTRMNSIFPNMLKRWNMGNQGGACYAWVNDVAHLRNRIVHGGYEPNESQTREVVHTLRELECEVKNILLHDLNRSRYPRTVFMWVGRPGLIKRSLYSGKLKRLDEDSLHLDWIGDFVSFRKDLDKKLWPYTGPVG